MGYPVPATGFMVTNLSTSQASNFLNPEDLLRSEVEESQRKLQVVSDTLSFFKRAFQDRREHLHTYFKEDSEIRTWDFQVPLVFVRLNGFLGRLCVVEVSRFIHPRLPSNAGASTSSQRLSGSQEDVFWLMVTESFSLSWRQSQGENKLQLWQ